MGEMVSDNAKTVAVSMSYMPLPASLRIGDSDVHGQGLFAKEDIPQGTDLGLSHVFVMHDWDGIIWGTKYWQRTPLGGFINHSDEPNCVKSQVRVKPHYDKWTITVIEDIEEGEELTLKYTMYDPEKK